MRMVTFVPAPSAVSMVKPILFAEDGPQPFVDVVQTDSLFGCGPGQGAAQVRGVGADAVVLHGDQSLGVGVQMMISSWPGCSLGSIP